jgi:hypothetical protein
VFSEGLSRDVNFNKISPPDRASDEVQIRVVVVNPLIFKKKNKKKYLLLLLLIGYRNGELVT